MSKWKLIVEVNDDTFVSKSCVISCNGLRVKMETGQDGEIVLSGEPSGGNASGVLNAEMMTNGMILFRGGS
ncbi:MAG: hypothetical protein DRN81_03050 [Thermoproteota archaeon]|nr:MAG: hypothetical protein DRN81_03050 [Candidatus Korarchaeota archaeon]